jgi:nicotinate phosphoribosyltransferase
MKGRAMKERLPADLFDLPTHQLRCGYRSDIYFWRAKNTLEQHGIGSSATMQVFQKNDAILCGMDEALAVLRVASGHYTDPRQAETLFQRYMQAGKDRDRIARELDDLWEDGYEQLSVQALYDGDRIAPYESVMHITGPAALFAHLETVYLGILARRTRIASNVRRVVDASAGKPVLFFPARFDHWAMQEGDGYAAFIGGAFGVSAAAQTAWVDAEPLGTVPHALIAAVDGDTVQAVSLFGESFPEVHLVALVDFDNDCVKTALECCAALGDRLWGVRLDTAENLIDQSVSEPGVTPGLVELTRRQLDHHGFSNVKIVVSGGFNPERIQRFEVCAAPVDAYGVGSWLLQGAYDFTADVVLVNGKPCSKVGRTFNPNPRLSRVDGSSSGSN